MVERAVRRARPAYADDSACSTSPTPTSRFSTPSSTASCPPSRRTTSTCASSPALTALTAQLRRVGPRAQVGRSRHGLRQGDVRPRSHQVERAQAVPARPARGVRLRRARQTARHEVRLCGYSAWSELTAQTSRSAATAARARPSCASSVGLRRDPTSTLASAATSTSCRTSRPDAAIYALTAMRPTHWALSRCGSLLAAGCARVVRSLAVFVIAA